MAKDQGQTINCLSNGFLPQSTTKLDVFPTHFYAGLYGQVPNMNMRSMVLVLSGRAEAKTLVVENKKFGPATVRP